MKHFTRESQDTWSTVIHKVDKYVIIWSTFIIQNTKVSFHDLHTQKPLQVCLCKLLYNPKSIGILVFVQNPHFMRSTILFTMNMQIYTILWSNNEFLQIHVITMRYYIFHSSNINTVQRPIHKDYAQRIS